MPRATAWLIGGCVLLLGLGATCAYFLYVPEVEGPPLRGSLRGGMVRVGELERRYVTYVPPSIAPQPPLLIALHGSAGNATQMRRASAYGFERLADEHGFIVVYPEGYEGHWNDCRNTATYGAKRLRIDDVGFMRALVAHFRSAYRVDSSRVITDSLGIISAAAAMMPNEA